MVFDAYLDGRSPVEALIDAYLDMPKADVPLATLFTAVINTVPLDRVLEERIREGLKHRREAKGK